MAEEKNQIFRQKSLDRVSSPEELDKYIKTTSPSLWVLLVAIIILLFGIIVWGVNGKIESCITTGLVADGSYAKLLVSESDGEKITDESYVEIDGKKYEIISISNLTNDDPIESDYLLHKAELTADDWYNVVTIKCNLKAGEYKGKLVYEVISPVTFVLN